MRFYRCRCGDKTAWSTMGVALCDPCQLCRSTLAESPERHLPVEPHSWHEQTVKTDEGPKVQTICRNCHKSKKQVDEAKTQRHQGCGGPLLETGTIPIMSADVPTYRCLVCGAEFDASDYESFEEV